MDWNEEELSVEREMAEDYHQGGEAAVGEVNPHGNVISLSQAMAVSRMVMQRQALAQHLAAAAALNIHARQAWQALQTQAAAIANTMAAGAKPPSESDSTPDSEASDVKVEPEDNLSQENGRLDTSVPNGHLKSEQGTSQQVTNGHVKSEQDTLPISNGGLKTEDEANGQVDSDTDSERTNGHLKREEQVVETIAKKESKNEVGNGEAKVPKLDIKEETQEEDVENDEEIDSEESEEEEEESLIIENRLRTRKVNLASEHKKEQRVVLTKLRKIMAKVRKDRTKEEAALMRANPKLSALIRTREKKRKITELRKEEREDQPDLLARKCSQLAAAIARAKHLVVYTGAGISTAANIPDYRGPNGVWTLLDQGKEVAACDLASAQPTFTHRALYALYRRGKLKHVVSQNCDGLHMRSGLPRAALSEIHGNMFIEVCKKCRPQRPFIRLFDVTERTNRNKHNTMRRCYVCGTSLIDTIVHFGEKGSLRWPINWQGASRSAEKADVILCLGSSLKVLRSYHMLWCMGRPRRERPQIFIVNLQWTPKDSSAKLKINGKCDEVMERVMNELAIAVPEYYPNNDPLFSVATPLAEPEQHTTTKGDIVKRDEIEAERLRQEEIRMAEVKREEEEKANKELEMKLREEEEKRKKEDEEERIKREEEEKFKKEEETITEEMEEEGPLKNGDDSAKTNGDISQSDSTRRRPRRAAAVRANLNGFNGSSFLPAVCSLSSSSSKPKKSSKPKLTMPASKEWDYRSQEWPRDPLYAPYPTTFEYLPEKAGPPGSEGAWVCDCCDPARNSKLKNDDSDGDEEENGDNSNSSGSESDDDDDLSDSFPSEEDSCDSKTVQSENSSSCSTPAPASAAFQPGWFGKGRKRKAKS